VDLGAEQDIYIGAMDFADRPTSSGSRDSTAIRTVSDVLLADGTSGAPG